MAAGIDDQQFNDLKVLLLDYIEDINALVTRYEICYNKINQNFVGPGKDTIINLLNSIYEQFSIVKNNINSYITDMNFVQSSYETQDSELSNQVTSDINKLESMKGD